MLSEYIERVKIWTEMLQKDFYHPLADIPAYRMTTYDNLGFPYVHDMVRKQIKSGEADTAKYADEDERFFKKYPAEWGHKWQYGWFYAEADISQIPLAKGKRLELIPDVGGEMLIEVNNELLGSRDLQHVGVTLTGKALGNEKYSILIESYAGHGPRPEDGGPVFSEKPFTLETPENQVKTGSIAICAFNEEAYLLYMDMFTLFSLYKVIDKKSLRAQKLIKALFEATKIIDFECCEEARTASYTKAREILKPALDCVNGSTTPSYSLFGQSHLDLAWRWTLEETRRKCARTYSTQLSLLREYPEYRFFGCCPYIFESLKQDYPKLFEQIKEYVKSGRIFVDGGMYVESDCNIPSGEALIRQFIFAKKWYKENFDIDTVMLWLPDCFGFSGQLPQILRQCGIKYFSTQKLFRAREGCEKFPYNEFYWEGIDGTRILCDMYKKNNARLNPEQLYERWEKDRVQDEDIEELMFPFGFGDGGGGPTRDMLEVARRVTDLEGLARTKWESPVDFFKRLEKRGTKNVYKGELYLSWHRGTYTAQAGIKQLNRRAEAAIREAEMWNAIACFCCGKAANKVNSDTVDARLEKLEKQLAFLQFHDILPGTSIERVNSEAKESFEEIIEEALIIAHGERERIAERYNADGTLLWNSLSGEREPFADFTIPSIGYAKLPSKEKYSFSSSLICEKINDGDVLIANRFLSAVIGRNGELRSVKLRDDNDREYLSVPKSNEANGFAGYCENSETSTSVEKHAYGNRFRLFRNVNVEYDAWELSTFYKDEEVSDAIKKAEIENYGISARGPFTEAYADVVTELSGSTIRQHISIGENSREITFTTKVEWNELHKILQVDFPLNIYSTEVIAQTQFGYEKRPAHRSKQSDKDRFEGAMHMYCAMTEEGRGAAVLNDSKYGCSALDNVLTISLLRAPVIPDTTADKGTHEFTYAFMPFTGTVCEGKVVQKAYELNMPITVTEGNKKASSKKSSDCMSFFKVNKGNIVIETVKNAINKDGSIIVRLYEADGASGECTLSTPFDILNAYKCDCLENVGLELKPVRENEESMITFSFRPFEVITLKLKGTERK